MEDIDRTFAILKKVDYKTLVSAIKKSSMVINPCTSMYEYVGNNVEQVCIDNGWTIEELNRELNRIWRTS
jgi:hypothetical protein